MDVAYADLHCPLCGKAVTVPIQLMDTHRWGTDLTFTFAKTTVTHRCKRLNEQ